MSIQFKAELQTKVPESLPVYRLAPPQASLRTVARAAHRLGLTGKSPDYSLSED